jgi:branched-chain amino acid transport system ATP-binding protein
VAELGVLDRDTDDAEPRPLVPSARELALGVAETQTWEMAPPPPPAPPPPTRRQRLQEAAKQLNPWHVAAGAGVAPLLIVGLLQLLGGADYQALFVLIPQMQPDFGYDLAFLALFNGVLNAVTLLAAPGVGYLADRTRRVWLLRAGGVVMHGGSILMGLAGSAGGLLGARTIQATGKSLQDPASFPLLTDVYPAEARGRVFAFVMQCGTLGGIIGAPIIGVIAAAYGWHSAFIALGLFSLLLTGFYFLLREPVRGAQDRAAMGADPGAAMDEQRPVGWNESWRTVSSIRTVRRMWFAQPFLSVAGFTSLLIPIYFAITWHVGPAGYGFIIAAEGVATLLGQALTGPLVDRMLADRPGRIMSLVAGIAVVKAFTLVLVAFAPNFTIAIVTACVASACGLLITPSFSPPILGLISLVTPARVRAFGMQSLMPWTLLSTPIIYAGATYFQSVGLSPGVRFLPYIPFYLVGAAILLSGRGSVDRDIRTAIAVSIADEEARRARAEGRTKLLVCRGLEVTYDGAQVLFGVDLDVEEGEIVALLGTNGAGKSTVLRAVSGVQEASGGAIFFDGNDITHSPPHRNARGGVVLVPGGRAIFPSLTVTENLGTALANAGDEEDGAPTIESVLSLFPALRDRLDTVAGNLSGGEQQMVALSQALLMRPRLLMIDELSLGLAPQVVEQLLAVIRRINAAGTTVILVEQSVNVALTIARRAVFMEKGQVVYEGPTAELLSRGDIVKSTFLGQAGGAASLSSGRRAPSAVSDEVEELLELVDVAVGYGGVVALDGVSMRVESGEIVGIIGPNGAGKTTLFDVISGFTSPSRGEVRLLGSDARRLGPDARARLGLTRSFQNVRLFGAMTVRETIAVALERHLRSRSAAAAALWLPVTRRSERRARRRVDNLVDSLGLSRYAESFVNELSTGTRRIVDLACLLAAEPRLLLLDEPSSGLAQAETEELGPLVGRIAKEAGCSIVIIEHDLPLITSVSTRLIAMERGRVIATGTPREVVTDESVVRAYAGASDEVVKRSGLVAAQATGGETR